MSGVKKIEKHYEDIVKLIKLIDDKSYIVKLARELKNQNNKLKELKKEKKEEKKEENKEEKDETKYHLEYYQKNKEKILEFRKIKVMCECGIESNKRHISRHKKTKLHIERMKELEDKKKEE